jgi:hypothetical protein
MPSNPEEIIFGDVRKVPIPIDIDLGDLQIPFIHENKKAGDVLKSQDWNTGMQEIMRLNRDKVDRKGDTITGSLTIGNALTVMGNTTLSAGTKDTVSVLSLKGQLSKGIAATIVLQNSAGGAGGGGSLDFNGYDVNADAGKRVPTARIQSIDDGDYSSHLGFYTKPSGKINELRERLRIASNGNVGIGTNGPIAKLDISSVARTDTHPTSVKGLYVKGDFGPDSDGIEFRHTNGTQGIGFGYNTIYATGVNTDQDLGLKPKGNGKVNITGKLSLIGSSRSISLEGGTQSPDAGAIRFGDGTGWKLHFGRSQESSGSALNSGTAGVLMTINDTGKVGIGTTDPKAQLQVTGIANITSGNGNNYANTNNFMAPGSLTIGGTDRNYGGGYQWSTNTAGLLLETLDNTEIAVHDAGIRLASLMYYEGALNKFTIGRDMGYGPIGMVEVKGTLNVVGGQILNNGIPIDIFRSSREIKQDIISLSDDEAISMLNDLNPVKYDLKTGKNFRQNLGFIAEEMPDGLRSEDRKTISPLEIIPVLTKMIQLQQQAINSLQEDLRSLKASIELG